MQEHKKLKSVISILSKATKRVPPIYNTQKFIKNNNTNEAARISHEKIYGAHLHFSLSQLQTTKRT